MRSSVHRAAVVCIALGLLPFLLPAQLQRIDGARTVILQESVHPDVHAGRDQGPLDPSVRIGYATLMLKPSGEQQAALERLLDEQQDRSSGNYHRWLTPEQFGERFALGVDDYAAVLAWLEAEGLHVEKRARARNWVAFSGSAGQVQHTFRTEIHRYIVDGEQHFANSTELRIPAPLEGRVAGVRNLDDFWRKAQPMYVTGSGARRLAPDDWATIYNVTPLYNMGIDGTGQRIAILGRSDFDKSLLTDFRNLFGLPPAALEMHLVGPDPGITNTAGEAALDVEWSSAIARGATIVYVYANNFNDAAQAAVDQNLASVMSESFGTCEPQSAVAIRGIAQQANAQGITWVASSGDSGGADCDAHGRLGGSGFPTSASAGLAVGIPASFPEVTAIGGTQFSEGSGNYWSSGGAALSYIPEAVWNETGASGLLAGGGGSSIYFPKPAWQIAPGGPDDNTRDIPDISFSAAIGHDAYFVINANGQTGTGGTSAAAPSFAGVVALLNQYLVAQGRQPGLGNMNPNLYRLARLRADVFHDITQGSSVVPCDAGSPDCANGSLGFGAGPGYDLATGLGSVDVYNLVTEWSAPSSPTVTTVAADPAAMNLGDTVQLTATVAPASDTPGVPTGSVTFITGRTILGTSALADCGAVAKAVLSVTRPLLPAGNASVSATYSGDSAFDGSTGAATVTVAAQSAGSAVVVSIAPNPAHEGQLVKVTLTEMNGVGTRITGWTINGVDDFPRFIPDFGANLLPPQGTLSTTIITAAGVPFPSNRVYVFSGVDADGRTWSQQFTLTLVGSATPGMVLTGVPASNPSCGWTQGLVLKELNGLSVQLSRLLVAGTDRSAEIAQLFGSSMLAPVGTLEAQICWPAPPPNVVYEVDGIDQTGSPVKASFNTFPPAQ